MASESSPSGNAANVTHQFPPPGHSRTRVSVVCAECKRLKLKCDRKSPCGSCAKRGNIVKCIYAGEAVEKIDFHSLHNRISSLNDRLVLVESTLAKMNAAPPAFQSPSQLSMAAYAPSTDSVALLADDVSMRLDHLDKGVSQLTAPYTHVPPRPKPTSDAFELEMTPPPSDIELCNFHPYRSKVQSNWRTKQKDRTEMQPTQTSEELLLMQSGFNPGGTGLDYLRLPTPRAKSLHHQSPSPADRISFHSHLPFPDRSDPKFVFPTTDDQNAAPRPSSMSSQPQAFPYAQLTFPPRAVQDTSTNVNFTSSLKLRTQDEAKPPTDASTICKHFVIGAESALEGIQGKETVIETAFADFQIFKSEYAVLAGFNEALMRSGTGYLPEIHVFCSVDIAQRTESLVTKLGKILSPLPGALFTPTSTYRIPVFQNDETLLSWDELVFSRTERYADIRSAVVPTSIQVVSRPQGSWSDGGTSAPSSFSGNELKDSDSDKKDTDDAGNNEGEDENSGDREGDDGNPDHEDPDDPTDGSVTSSLPAVSFDAQAKVYATTANTASPNVFQELQVNGRLIIQSYPPRSKLKRLPKSCVEFKKLKFQGRRVVPTTGYEQVHARVVVDAKEELTRVDAIKPSRTPAIGLESMEVTTRQSSSALGFSGSAGFGSPSIKGMFSGHLGAESSSYLETRNYGSRITQGDSYGVVWWGFNIDDPHAQEAGIELLDTLPSAEFEFLGKNASLPARLHAEVISCWSLISSCENRQSWIQALIGLAKPKGLSYSNLCQIVQLEIPSALLEDYEYMSLTHVTQSGCHTQVKLEGSHPVHVTPSVVFLDGPVSPDSGILRK